MEAEEVREGLRTARTFLSRWSDETTRSGRDEIAWGALTEAWIARGSLRRPERFQAFVRTITRRVRGRRVLEEARRGGRGRLLSLDAILEAEDDERAGEFADPAAEADPCESSIAGLSVETEHLCAWLWSLLDPHDLSHVLLQRHCEGFSCRELACSFDLSATSVKSRIHRARRALALEAMRRMVDGAGPSAAR